MVKVLDSRKAHDFTTRCEIAVGPLRCSLLDGGSEASAARVVRRVRCAASVLSILGAERWEVVWRRLVLVKLLGSRVRGQRPRPRRNVGTRQRRTQLLEIDVLRKVVKEFALLILGTSTAQPEAAQRAF